MEVSMRRTASNLLTGFNRSLAAAIITNDVDATRTTCCGQPPLYIDQNGNTPLHLAAKSGSVDVLRWLLRNSGIRVTMRNSRGESCAHVAAKYGHVACLRLILFHGRVRPGVVVRDNNRHGMSVVHLAVVGGHHGTVVWLTNTFGKNVGLLRNGQGQTALHLAAAGGCTAVYYASQEGRAMTLRHLVDIARSNLHVNTKDGLTPLHAAAQTGRVDIVHFLLRKVRGTDNLRRWTKDGATVFHMAAANGQLDTLALLLKQPDADHIVRMRDVFGSSPAHDAAENGHTNCLRLLYAVGLDMHQPDKDGQTPCTLAVRSGCEGWREFDRMLDVNQSLNGDSGGTCVSNQDPKLYVSNEIDRGQYKLNVNDSSSADTFMVEEKKGLFRRIRETLDEERRVQQLYERHINFMKRHFTPKRTFHKRVNQHSTSYVQKNRRAPVSMPVGGKVLIVNQHEDGSDITAETFLDARNVEWKDTLQPILRDTPSRTPTEMKPCELSPSGSEETHDTSCEDWPTSSSNHGNVRTSSRPNLGVPHPGVPAAHGSHGNTTDASTQTHEPVDEKYDEKNYFKFGQPLQSKRSDEVKWQEAPEKLRRRGKHRYRPKYYQKVFQTRGTLESIPEGGSTDWVGPPGKPTTDMASGTRGTYVQVPQFDCANAGEVTSFQNNEEGFNWHRATTNAPSISTVNGLQDLYVQANMSTKAFSCCPIETGKVPIPNDGLSVDKLDRSCAGTSLKQRIHPTIDALKTILERSGIIAPYLEHQRSSFRATREGVVGEAEHTGNTSEELDQRQLVMKHDGRLPKKFLFEKKGETAGGRPADGFTQTGTLPENQPPQDTDGHNGQPSAAMIIGKDLKRHWTVTLKHASPELGKKLKSVDDMSELELLFKLRANHMLQPGEPRVMK